jgi:hypothetical protein
MFLESRLINAMLIDMFNRVAWIVRLAPATGHGRIAEAQSDGFALHLAGGAADPHKALGIVRAGTSVRVSHLNAPAIRAS